MADPITHPPVSGGTSARAGRESIPDLLKDVRDQTSLLLRQEVILARTELSEKISRLVRNAAYLAAGGAVAFAGFLFLLHSATAGVARGLDAAGMADQSPWLAPLLVGAVVALIGGSTIRKGLSAIKHESLVPEKTLDSLKEDKEWMQDKVS